MKKLKNVSLLLERLALVFLGASWFGPRWLLSVMAMFVCADVALALFVARRSVNRLSGSQQSS